MNKLSTAVVATAAAIGIGLGAFGVAAATSSQSSQGDDGPGESVDSDAPLTGTDLDKAVAAALQHTGGGEVTETETGDDGAAYGIEVRKADGSQVEVNLDADFEVIGANSDDD